MNELGIREGCESDPLNTYAVINMIEKNVHTSIGSIGLCVPIECQNQQDWQGFLGYISDYVKPFVPFGMEANVVVDFPALEEQKAYPASFWLVLTPILIMVLLSVLGSIISWLRPTP